MLRAIWGELPAENIIYLADQVHVPYGSRSADEVRSFSKEITQYLLDQGAKLIVVACNTASAAALHYLRQTFAGLSFVGMEPAVKPAAEHTHSKVVGVLATPATFQGELYASVVERFASDVKIIQHTCPRLVMQIEAGHLQTPETRLILEAALEPMVSQGIDTVVLGCTHYPFVIPLIQQIVGPGVRVIDPAPAVARQVRRLLETRKLLYINGTLLEQTRGRTDFISTGSENQLQSILTNLLNIHTDVRRISWKQSDTNWILRN